MQLDEMGIDLVDETDIEGRAARPTAEQAGAWEEEVEPPPARGSTTRCACT